MNSHTLRSVVNRPVFAHTAFVLFGLLGLVSSAAAQVREGRRASPIDDAELTAVTFIDDERGWVVGAGGVVLHTADGGATWQRQPSGVTARLRSVAFVDERHGWIVGGEYDPYLAGSRGLVLRTLDGGATWRREPSPMLPALRQVRFTSLQEGWAVGDPTTFAPTGLFFTRDGGKTWNPGGGTIAAPLLCVELTSPHAGAALTAAGDAVVVEGRIVHETPAAQFGLRAPRKLLLRNDGRGLLVGDGGLVAVTDDAGAAWEPCALELANTSQAAPDWRGVAAAGTHWWIVGSPGSIVLHSPDDGRTWESFATGQSLPLHDVAFVDEQHGWAVGAMGTLLRTTDGGRTWEGFPDHRRRAALWSCFAEARDLPLELLTQATGDGYRTVSLSFGRREFDVTSGRRDWTVDREADALARIGVVQADRAWAFPLRQPLLRADPLTWLHAWEGTNDADALERAEAYLVRELRTWRPDVVLTHAASPRGDSPTEHLLHLLVVQAVESAADATRFPEQAARWNLAPWQVKRVFTHAPGQQRGTVALTTGEIDVRRGAAPVDLTAACRARLFATETPPPLSLAARLVVNRSASVAGDRGLCAGLGIAANSEARRTTDPASTEALLQARQVTERRRNLLAIAARTAQTDEAAVAQIHELAVGLDDERAAQLVFQLAESFRKSGRWEAARKSYELIAARYPAQPTCEAALERLIHYLASGELDRRLQVAAAAKLAENTDRPTSLTTVEPPPPILGQVAPEAASEALPKTPEPTSAADAGNLIGYANEAARRQRCLGIAAFAERRDPMRSAEPTIGFAVAAARRKLGQTAEAELFYDGFFRSHRSDAWWEWAGVESSRPGKPATTFKRQHRAKRAAEAPLLDGRLDDAIWTTAQPLPLRSPLGDDAAWPAAAFVAHDTEHLYLAVRCKRAPGDDVPAPSGARTRDADLSEHDRVDFCLDVDRDLATYYRLTIDRRGWTAESCWDDATWNPQWFVAAGGDETTWVVEAAIAWSELVAEPPKAGTSWACGIQRLAPTAGLQAWTAPADIDVRPEGFGVLTFE
jgi:photosystem II stability/assembly factor-like uncharacterized protein/tetratricopeptide (TPR) repeat protein